MMFFSVSRFCFCFCLLVFMLTRQNFSLRKHANIRDANVRFFRASHVRIYLCGSLMSEPPTHGKHRRQRRQRFCLLALGRALGTLRLRKCHSGLHTLKKYAKTRRHGHDTRTRQLPETEKTTERSKQHYTG